MDVKNSFITFSANTKLFITIVDCFSLSLALKSISPAGKSERLLNIVK